MVMGGGGAIVSVDVICGLGDCEGRGKFGCRRDLLGV